MISRKELRQKCNAATPGPWKYRPSTQDVITWNNETVALTYHSKTEANQVFLAAANPATVLALLDALENVIGPFEDLIHSTEEDMGHHQEWQMASKAIQELREVIGE